MVTGVCCGLVELIDLGPLPWESPDRPDGI